MIIVKESDEKEVIELIDLVIKWYPREDIDNEWDKWSKDLEKEEIKKKKSILRSFIFILKEYASEKVTKEQLKEDFKNLDLTLSYLEHFTKKLESEKKFQNKAFRNKRPLENKLKNIDWRIDKRMYNDGDKENIAVIEFYCTSKGEKEIIPLDFNHKSLKHLISLLTKIEKELCQIG